MNASIKMKIVYIVLTVLMVTFFVRDWYVYLVGCGAVEQCLQDSSHYQNYAKFAVTARFCCAVMRSHSGNLWRPGRSLPPSPMWSATENVWTAGVFPCAPPYGCGRRCGLFVPICCCF